MPKPWISLVALAVASAGPALAFGSVGDVDGVPSPMTLVADQTSPPAPVPAPAAALDRAAPEAKPWSLTLFLENDSNPMQPFEHNDRHYTHGMRLSFAHQPQWAEDIAPYVPFNEAYSGGRTGAGYFIGHSMYTPDDITLVTPDPKDRPFAGWLYGGAFWQRDTGPVQPGDVGMMDHLEINLGVVGPASQAEGLQKWWHVFDDARTPRGWDHQLNDEFGFDLIYQHFWRVALFDADGLQGQVVPRAGFTLGNIHRQANADAMIRIGCNLPDDYGPGRLDQPGAATGLAERARVNHFSVYGYARAGGRAVQHNLFLECNTFGDSAGVNERPLVGELQMGVALEFWQHVEFTYSVTYLTKEFYHQAAADSYGAATLAIFFGF
ncbi:MAG: lipid A deacylase LpxR family protein [Planctomycetota bacterium]|nr:lipid A deacylase LpxR family protein [Planctomycetota bacterium]